MRDSIIKFVWKYKKILALAFVLGFLLPNVNGLGLQTSVTDYSKSESIDAAIITYHVEVNDITNEFIKTLITEKTPNVAHVLDSADCESGNVSTYCLAVRLNDELLGLELYLTSRLGELAEVEEDEDEELNDLEKAIAAAASQDYKITTELVAAQDSLDVLLNVYNQIQLVYPLHREFGVLFTSLEGFNKALANVRNEVEVFPSTFNDVTMVKCQ
jgi:hypothetical protein